MSIRPHRKSIRLKCCGEQSTHQTRPGICTEGLLDQLKILLRSHIRASRSLFSMKKIIYISTSFNGYVDENSICFVLVQVEVATSIFRNLFQELFVWLILSYDFEYQKDTIKTYKNFLIHTMNFIHIPKQLGRSILKNIYFSDISKTKFEFSMTKMTHCLQLV